MFLGTILTDAELQYDAPDLDSCGTCSRCLDICPTGAFVAPYQLDARRCISYLTIEHKGQIPENFRSAIGNRIFGCDDCLAVCPWNKFASRAAEEKFFDTGKMPALSYLLQLHDAAFRKLFAGSPVRRTGHIRFMRNVLVAAGNSGEEALAPLVESLLSHTSPLVRGMAVWALSQLVNGNYYKILKLKYAPFEADYEVFKEWREF